MILKKTISALFVEQNKMKSDIISMLDDMNETQIENVYNYTCNEYDEEGHEGNLAELLVKVSKENALRKIVLELQQPSRFFPPRML